MANYKLMVNENKVKGLALNGKILYKDTAESAGSAPMNVKNIHLVAANNGVRVTWVDPDDTYDADGTLLAKWAGTKVVYKTTGWPTSPTDGTLAIDNTVRNTYKTNSLNITNLVDNTTYYFSFFTYSDTNVINYNQVNRASVKAGLLNVTFADATDNEISLLLEKHYNGEINIANYWHVGDTRLVHINETNSGYNNYSAQDMTMVIYDFNHDDLTTNIKNKTKAAVTVGFREVMAKNGGSFSETVYYMGESNHDVNINDNYSKTPLREWFNNGLLMALPNSFNSLIKEVNKKNLYFHTMTNSSPVITQDKLWLLSYPEVFGTEICEVYLNNADPGDWEGYQYEYMKTGANREKHPNNNGTPSSDITRWLLRSPSSKYYSGWGYKFLEVSGSNIRDIYGFDYSTLSLAFCL